MEEENTPVAQSYEIMLVLVPDLGEDKSNKELEEVRKSITGNGGNITHEDIWGVRDLAYRIKQHDKGYYAVVNFDLDPSRLAVIEKPFNINRSVLRYMTIKTPAGYKVVTLGEYEEQWSEEEIKVKEEEDAKQKEKVMRTLKKKAEKPKEEVKVKEKVKRPIEKVEEVEEIVEKVEIPEEKEAPSIQSSKEAKSKLDEVDAKLKSIIDDPDISL